MKYPGVKCVLEILRLKEFVEKGDYSPPILGTIRREKDSVSFVLFDADDIIVGEKQEGDYPFIAIRQGDKEFIVTADIANELRVGKDARGKTIFLSLFE